MFDLASVSTSHAMTRLTGAVAAACDVAPDGSAQERADAVSTMLAAIDHLYAGVLSLIGGHAIAAVSGLPTEMFLMYEGRLPGWEARALVQASEELRGLPHLADAARRRLVSWSQVRAILRAMKPLRAEDRRAVDELIGRIAPAHVDADPERIITIVENEATRRRDSLQVDREQRAVETRSLWMQAGLDGSGVLCAQGPIPALESVHQALVAAADAPEQDVPRSRQLFDALIDIAETSLAGGTTAGSAALRPRPRLLATFDVAGLTDAERDQGMQMLTALAGGRPLRLSSVARDELLCDAAVTPIIMHNNRPNEVGDEYKTFSDKNRTAILARDKRCRFCGRAATLFDVHHITPGVGGHAACDGILLCRRCHSIIHAKRWRIRWIDDHGTLEFRRRGRRFTGPPT